MVKKQHPEGFPYGPYFRYEQSDSAAFMIQRSGVLRGKSRGNIYASDIPAVKAYTERATVNHNVTFYAKVPPDSNTPPAYVQWSLRDRVEGEVRLVNEGDITFVEIDVCVTQNLCKENRSKNIGPPAGVEERRSSCTEN